MNKFNTKSWFVGIDISKDSIDVSLFNKYNSNSYYDQRFKNDLKGFDLMLKWLLKHQANLNDCLFCMEHTGTYGLLLFTWLSGKETDFCVESGLQIKRSLGITRGKNDKVDARRIAKYAFVNRESLSPFTLPTKSLIQIKQLLTYRDQLIKCRGSFKNSLKSHKQYQQISELSFVAEDIQEQIESLSKRIVRLEERILETIQSDPALKTNFKLATSVTGIGFVIAAFMLVTTNNFSSFENGRKYACYTGNAPFELSSGKSIKHPRSVSHLANKRLKTLLSNGANAAYRSDPEIRNFYKRKTEEGKDHKLIINAISCKLINRVFAVIKRQTPYVTTYQQKIV